MNGLVHTDDIEGTWGSQFDTIVKGFQSIDLKNLFFDTGGLGVPAIEDIDAVLAKDKEKGVSGWDLEGAGGVGAF